MIEQVFAALDCASLFFQRIADLLDSQQSVYAGEACRWGNAPHGRIVLHLTGKIRATAAGPA